MIDITAQCTHCKALECLFSYVCTLYSNSEHLAHLELARVALLIARAGRERAHAASRLAHGDPHAARSAAGRLRERARRLDQLRRRVCYCTRTVHVL